MDYVSIMVDSVETAVSMGFFTTKEKSAMAHIYRSTLSTIPITEFTHMENFDATRLHQSAAKAYPPERRPRGADDLIAVARHRRYIRRHGETPPIWVLYKGGKYTLLDGAHRIVAAHIENRPTIAAYVVRP
jgi:hypothetical protein